MTRLIEEMNHGGQSKPHAYASDCARCGMEAVAERVIELWNGGQGWIPGAAFTELAEALGVSTDRLTHYKGRGEGHHTVIPPCRCEDPTYLYCWPHRRRQP